MNANKLQRAILAGDSSDISRETYEKSGDWEAETELAREALERVRLKHGIASAEGETGLERAKR